MLPQQNGLIVDELAALRTDNFASELFALQEIEEVETHRVLDELGKFWLLPVEEIFEVVHEIWVLKVVTLGENCGIKKIHEFIA